MTSETSLPHNIDKLLEFNSSYENISDNDDHSDDCKSDDGKFDDESHTPYLNKHCNRRHASRVPEELRLRVNSRERQRMHDLNSALESLRATLPYSHGPSVKKISKMATLLLARNYIVNLNKSLDEMRKLVGELSSKQQATSVGTPHFPTTEAAKHAYPYPHIHSMFAPVKVPMPAHCVAAAAPIGWSIPCPCPYCQPSVTVSKSPWKPQC